MHWIGIDWGTSNLRAWKFDENDSLVSAYQSNDGMGSLSKGDYPVVLEKILRSLDVVSSPADVESIIVCGMAGAKQGWQEAPYLSLPLDLESIPLHSTRVQSQFENIHILPGVAQHLVGQNDVMRGEETQLLGLLDKYQVFSGTVAMPGTHSKWATLESGRLTSFQTVLTGELFDILSNHSVLRHSMPDETSAAMDDEGLADGLQAGMAAPEMLQSLLFKTRASGLISAKSNDWAKSYLSGLLIGTEVKTNAPPTPQKVPIVGSPKLAPIYRRALQKLGHDVLELDATEITIAGLKLAHRLINQNEPSRA